MHYSYYFVFLFIISLVLFLTISVWRGINSDFKEEEPKKLNESEEGVIE